ncbi:hypothetical protein BpHYR1_032670 [Brachionus plicatilis]|uniref:Uncharacterized protein n=1 Tax=Brachionus plicatilis TaxID=10195 RepID=A0A3M7PT90_BRAPC|nr:hypothetical protein BpHYR1_032670 [Brachionus plicatilis]
MPKTRLHFHLSLRHLEVDDQFKISFQFKNMINITVAFYHSLTTTSPLFTICLAHKGYLAQLNNLYQAKAFSNSIRLN